MTGSRGFPFDEFRATADAVARDRPDVDLAMAREVFDEAATLLHDGLVLDDLDEHDARAVVDALRVDLLAADPGEAIRGRAQTVLADSRDLHDAEGVSAALLVTAALFQL